MKVFHHNDLDGRCAAFVVGHFTKKLPPLHLWPGGVRHVPFLAEFMEMDYDCAFPFDQVEKDERIFIVDFSIEPEDMVTLLKITSDVHWIDHHGTALAKYEGWQGEKIEGSRNTEAAGCVLTYKYCMSLLRHNFYDLDEKVPWFIKLVGDRDTWRWEYGDRTRFFFRGLSAHDTAPDSKVWYDAWESTTHFEAIGKPVEMAFAQSAKEDILKSGFWVEFEGHKCFVVNGGVRGSDYLERFVPGADVWITFRYANDQWSIRLYSYKVDVAEIAKQYVHKGRRGGGHPLEPGRGSAAGFQCAYPPFLPAIQSDVSTYRDLRKRLG